MKQYIPTLEAYINYSVAYKNTVNIHSATSILRRSCVIASLVI